jgi:hypothetical protein
MTRLTPEVCFPESEGWPQTYFAGPFPLSENHYLTSWSAQPLPPGTPRPHWGMPGPPNDLGLYLFDAFGNLEPALPRSGDRQRDAAADPPPRCGTAVPSAAGPTKSRAG